MRTSSFKCPTCGDTYDIQDYNLGFLDAIEMRCDQCSNTLWVSLYDEHTMKIAQEARRTLSRPSLEAQEFYLRRVESALRPCECGGSFHESSAYRCRTCNHKVALADIVPQIGWHGLPEGKPGVALGKILDGDRSTQSIWRNGDP